MRWIIVTCSKSKWIVPIQKWLFKKYIPGADVTYIDMEDKPLDQWCKNVYMEIASIEDPLILFGLDDYLPCSPFRDNLKIPFGYDRVGIGIDDSRQKHTIPQGHFVTYSENSPYSVTCQFSIWQTDSLRKVLYEINGTPWDFEVKGKCMAAALKDPALKWAGESALSKKWEGVNVRGISREDLVELKNYLPNNLLNEGISL